MLISAVHWGHSQSVSKVRFALGVAVTSPAANTRALSAAIIGAVDFKMYRSC